MPLVSVIVPIHDVEDFLEECLASLVGQTLQDLEVLLVDDASTDRSREIAQSFAASRPDWHVLDVHYGSPGGTRNAGIAAATGKYLAFVDADDVVVRDGIERLAAVLEQTGSDLACGMALRYDGLKTWPSPLQRVSIRKTQLRTHITRTPSLLRDTTVWAKLYRREFWDSAGLRFPEGVLFEDMQVATIAQFKATSVDLLEQPVYWWRLRQSDSQSITQRRTEVGNLEDRMAALATIDGYLREHSTAAMKQAHDAKVLKYDFPVHMRALPDADEAFVERFVEVVGQFVRDVELATLGRLRPSLRLPYHLVARGLTAELVEVMTAARDPRRNRRFRRRGLRMYADLPYLFDRAVAVPDAVYDVTRSQPMGTGIRDVTWSGDTLVVDGHAYIQRTSMRWPWASGTRVLARSISDPQRRIQARLRRVRRLDVTARVVHQPITYDWSGLRARLDGRALVAASEQTSHWEVVAQVATLSARKGGRLGRPAMQRARFPQHRIIDGAVVAPYYAEDRWLTVQVWRPSVVVDHVGLNDREFRVGGQVASGDRTVRLGLFRRDSLAGIEVPTTVDAEGRLTGSLDLSVLEVRDDLVTETDWDLRLIAHDATGSAAAVVAGLPVAAAEGLMGDRFEHGGRALEADVSDRGSLYIRDRTAVPVATAIGLDANGLTVAGTLPTGSRLERLTLEHRDGSAAVLEVVSVADRPNQWTARFASDAEPGGPTALRWLHSGMWRLVAHLRPVASDATRDASDAGADAGPNAGLATQVGVRLDRSVVSSLEGKSEQAGTMVRLHVDRAGELLVGVDASGAYRDRGGWRRRRFRRRVYRISRTRPVQDVVLFESWRGKSFSDSPQAIYDELRRTHPQLRAVWALTSLAVERPRDAEVVLKGSRQYWALLARARWIVANDSLPTSYRRRAGQHYLQTWHGTPLKRLAFDVPDLKIANRSYLEEFAVEVAQWSWLVSPNPFSTDVLAKAFRYHGKVLETGYPRNDVFYDKQRSVERAAAARRRLNLPADRKVVLYAPTWRDDRYTSTGRYQFDMRLNLEQLRHTIGDDWIVLIRGHHVLSNDVRIAGDVASFVRNVTRYPDIQDLYLVADAVITDYSSVMFDFANTGRPMIFFTWDLENYRDELRGFYFDLTAQAPGPLVRTTEEVAKALQNLDDTAGAYADRYAAFRDQFCSLEDGQAARRVVEAVWGAGVR